MKIIKTSYGHVTVFPIIKPDGSIYEYTESKDNQFYPFMSMDIGDVSIIDSPTIFSNMTVAARRGFHDGRKFKCIKTDPRHNGMHTCERIS